MAVTKQQVNIYMSAKKSGCTQTTSAAKAGFSERTGRRMEKRGGCLTNGQRHWRTRTDPFAKVWENELRPMLQREPALQAITLLEYLQEHDPERYPDKLLRTLQRRVKRWRAIEGPDKEVMFRQEHKPGQLGLSDFTHLKGVTITIRGQTLSHQLYHFRLAYSGWCSVRVILGGESFTALSEGLQEALRKLGKAPIRHRTDSLSAAFKNLTKDEQTDITHRYQSFCEHYGMKATRNNPGHGHENGSIESAHGHLKRRIRQALLIRGSSDFETLDDYRSFVDQISAKINRRHQAKITEEHAYLQVIPIQKAAAYTEVFARVTSSSTINVKRVLYTVPARLIGERLTVQLFDNRLLLFLGPTEVLRLARTYPLPGKQRARNINYRHIISWLAKKPMAFRGLQFRDDLLPTEDWRRIWSYLSHHVESRIACKQVVGALKLAADHDCEQAIASYWLTSIEQEYPPTLLDLQKRFGRKPDPIPDQCFKQHDLASYDDLALLSAMTEPDVTMEMAHV